MLELPGRHPITTALTVLFTAGLTIAPRVHAQTQPPAPTAQIPSDRPPLVGPSLPMTKVPQMHGHESEEGDPLPPQSNQTLRTLERQLHSKYPQDVVMPALKRIASTPSLYKNPQIQASVIAMLNDETKNPDWVALSEMQSYEDFYTQLSEAVKVIATQTHNPEAWRALLISNYNYFSEFGKWLVAESETTMPFIIELAENEPSSAVRGNMLELMGLAIQPCRANPNLPICAKAEHLKSIIRRHAENDKLTTAAAISALGTGGTEADIPFLESLRNKPTFPAEEWAKPAQNRLIDQSERRIRGELKY